MQDVIAVFPSQTKIMEQLMFKRKKMLKGISLMVGMTLAGAAFSLQAQTPEEFYEGKTLRFMSTTGAGGTMDLYLLLTMKHMEKHLPESTDIVLDHRPGAGGAIGANWLFRSAPKDGTVIGMPVPAIVSSTFSNPNTVRYEPTEFQSVGRIVDLPRVYVGRTDAGLETLEDAINSDQEIPHSIMTVGTSLDHYMTIANEGVGTKFRRVAGYSGGGPAFLAMEQGEVASTTAEPANLFSNKWHLVENGEISVLAVGGMERMEQLPDTPTILEYMDESDSSYATAEAIFGAAAIGLSLIAPPGVPEDRIEYLRATLQKTLEDPEFIKEAEERGIPVNYAGGEFLDEVIENISASPEHVQQWFYNMANQ